MAITQCACCGKYEKTINMTEMFEDGSPVCDACCCERIASGSDLDDQPMQNTRVVGYLKIPGTPENERAVLRVASPNPSPTSDTKSSKPLR